MYTCTTFRYAIEIRTVFPWLSLSTFISSAGVSGGSSVEVDVSEVGDRHPEPGLVVLPVQGVELTEPVLNKLRLSSNFITRMIIVHGSEDVIYLV